MAFVRESARIRLDLAKRIGTGRLKQWCNWNGYKWVLKQQNLFDVVIPQPKKDIAKKTPQNAYTRKRVKESRGLKMKKSFLWGALTIERYE